MVIGKNGRQVLFALTSLIVAGKVVAQHTPAATPLTIERIVEERERQKELPADVTWSPSGKSLAYIHYLPKTGRLRDNSPTAEIWSLDSKTGERSLLVSGGDLTAALGPDHSHEARDGDETEKQEMLTDFIWAPSGRALLLATGNELAWFDLETHSSRLLTKNPSGLSNPQISPDGRFVSYIQEHALWLADVKTGAAHAFTHAGTSDLREGEPDWPYLHELGLQSAYWWSPDSSSIAWLETDDRAVDHYSLRNIDGDESSITYPKPRGAIPSVRLFVQSASGGKPRQIDVGGATNIYIPRVQWLPNSKQLSVERLSRDQKTLDLLLADRVTGKTRTILTENDNYWINLTNELFFLNDSHRFIWTSERSGYRHLYLYDLSGQLLAQLTKGDWEVTALAGVDEANGIIYFSATQASPSERQLYRVNLDGSNLARITQEKGTHEAVLSPTGDVLLDKWSSHTSPPRQELLHLDGSRIANLGDKVPEELQVPPLNDIEFITMKTHMGLELNAWMMKPPDFNPARQYPVIFYVAGGPGEQIVRDAWGGDISLWFALMAQSGYIVIAVDNRGTAGRGHLFEEPVHLRFAAAELADLRDAVLYLRTQPFVDKTRIGICGWGFGGFLALHGMLDRPVLFKAGFAGSPIADWHLYDAVFAERYLEDPVRNQDGWLASSPVENAKFLSGKLLLAQATLDETVHQENSLMVLDELLDKGKYADILLFPDRRNLFEDRGARLILFQRLTDFFIKNL